MNTELIEQFVEKKTIKALNTLHESSNLDEIASSAVLVADVFGGGESFQSTVAPGSKGEEKLIASFHNNLVLLIQKTWVEKSDEELKAKVLYQLDEFCQSLEEKAYEESYSSFFEILDNVVYLMFGAQSRNKDFDEYTLRIDPEFGVFWWYITSLPRDAKWTAEKTRVAVLLGMFFLANY